jgi:hypothetical protein
MTCCVLQQQTQPIVLEELRPYTLLKIKITLGDFTDFQLTTIIANNNKYTYMHNG